MGNCCGLNLNTHEDTIFDSSGSIYDLDRISLTESTTSDEIAPSLLIDSD